MKKLLIILTLLATFTFSTQAQTDTISRLIDLDEVVISSGKFAEHKREVPAQVQSIGVATIRFQNNQTTADLLQNSGNIFLQRSQMGGGSPVLRGFEASRVLIVIDGVRLNNAIYRSGHLQNVLRIDQNMLDKAEIVFGPGSVIYGSDALGGVMHLHSRMPQLAQPKTLTANAGAYVRYASVNNEKTGHINLNLGGGKWAALTAFTFSDFGDLQQGDNRRKDYPDFGKRLVYVERINDKDSVMVNKNPNLQVGSAYKQYDLLQKIRFQQNESVNHILNFQYSNTNDVPRYDRLSEIQSNGLPRFAEWYYGPEKRLLGSYQLQLERGQTWYSSARLTLAYQDIEESRHSRRFNNNNRRSQIEQVKVWSANFDAVKNLSDKNTLQYGAEFTYNNVESTAKSTNITTNNVSNWNTRYPDGGSQFLTSGIYLTNKHRLLQNKLIASGGLRLSYVKLAAKFESKEFFPFPYNETEQTNTALNGNLGLVWLPNATWKISLLGSSGFRAPNVDDLAKVFDSTPGSVFVPNPDIKPEYTWNGELGITKLLFDRVQLEATGFYTRYTNALTPDAFTFNGQDSIEYDGVMSKVFALTNKNNAFITGCNVAAKWDITNWLGFTASYNYTYGRIKTDSTNYPLDHIPPMFGRVGIKTQFSGFKGELFSLFNGWKRINDYNKLGEDNLQYATPDGMPAWATLNLRLSYRLLQFLEIQAGIENILDANYRNFASGISSPGRNFSATLRANM